jgi:hypothetical protein
MKFDRETFVGAVRESHSIAGVLRKLGLRVAGANYAMVHRMVAEYGLRTDHWTGMGHLRGRRHNWARKCPLSLILVSPSAFRGSTSSLKDRLLREKLIMPGCAICGISEWCGEHLVLHLDHVNGNRFDNRIENLRVLCPNCHSQTSTYCGRNKRRRSNADDLRHARPEIDMNVGSESCLEYASDICLDRVAVRKPDVSRGPSLWTAGCLSTEPGLR